MEEVEKKEKKYYDFISIAKRTSQEVYFIAQHDKNLAFELLLKKSEAKQIVVISKSKKSADSLCEYLKSKDIQSLAIHGNHRTQQIDDARASFLEKEINILITTDMILKSFELKHKMQEIVSYDLPQDPQDYFNRLRLVDEVGKSISFVSSDEEKLLEGIEFSMRTQMKEKEIEAFSPSQAPQKEKKKKKPRHSKKNKNNF